MALSLNTRNLGDVTVVRCTGRVVAGPENESLRAHIYRLLPDGRDVILDLSEVVFIDSSGLGTLVRLLTSLRRIDGDLKLCKLPRDIYNVLKMTNLISLFDTHVCEEDAIAAFYRRTTTSRRLNPASATVLCVDQSADVLAYVREVLRRASYNVLTSSSVHDAMILIRAARPGLLVVGPNLASSAGTLESFRAVSAALPVVELGDDFSTSDAGQAAAELLEKIRARLDSRSGVAS